MKKLLIALLALSVAGAAFAADPTLKFAGYVDTGLKYTADAKAGSADGWSAYAYDAGVQGFRVNLTATYDAGDYGAKFRLRAQGDQTKVTGATTTAAAGTDATYGTADDVYTTTATTGGSNYFFLKYGYAWATFAGLVKAKVGLVDDSTFETLGDFGDDVGEGYGILATAPVVPGLTLGAGLYAPDIYGASTTKFEDTIYTLGAKFAQDGVVDFRTSLKIDDSDLYSSLSGLTIYAVPKLGATLELGFTGLSDFSNIGSTMVVETLSYDLAPVTVGFIGYQWLPQADGVDAGYKLNPYVSYTMGKIVPQFDFVYLVNNEASLDKDAKAITFKPSVSYNVGTGCLVKAAYAYTLNDKNGAYGDDPSSEFQLRFTYSF